ncbi:MAG: hypothetical protein KatS3mg103_0036 [Phycisphaerales bacterium]|nr:MAG: hypothetical protein KatS3mg103_0036 [Phycisphaerales bacterium]
MPRNPRAKYALLAIGIILILAGLAGIALALLGASTPLWMMLLFEPLALGAGVVVLAVAVGLQRHHQPMALATAAMCLAVAAFLSALAAQNTLGSARTMPLMAGRLALAGVLGLWSAGMVLGPDRQAWKRVAIGTVCLLLAGLMALVMVAGQTKPIRDALLSMGGFIASAIVLVGFVVFVGLVSAGVHLIVRTFELALDRAERPGSPASTQPAQSA